MEDNQKFREKREKERCKCFLKFGRSNQGGGGQKSKGSTSIQGG